MEKDGGKGRIERKKLAIPTMKEGRKGEKRKIRGKGSEAKNMN